MRWSLSVLLVVCLLAGPGGCGREPAHVQRDRAIRRAVASLKAQENDKALEQIDQAIAADPEAAHAHQVRGSVLFHMERYDDAVAAYQRAATLNPRSAEARLGAALALRRLDREASAAGHLTEAERLFADRLANPPDAARFSQDYIDTAMIHAKIHLALIAAIRGESEAALGQVDRIAAAHPDWEEADAWRGIIRSGAFERVVGAGGGSR